MTKPKIAIVTSYMDRRRALGTAIVIRQIVKGLRAYRDAFDITLIHNQEIPEDPLYKEFREVVIPRLKLPKFSGFFSEVYFFLRTRERFDVYFYPYSRIFPTFWLAPARRIAFMLMDGGPQTAGFYDKNTKGLVPWHTRIFFRFVDKFVAISDFGRTGIMNVYKLPPERVVRIYNGLDDQYRSFVRPDDMQQVRDRLAAQYGLTGPYILDVSRFDPHKNILLMLDAYKKLVDEDQIPHKLVFVGGRHIPDYSDQVDRRIRELGLEDRVVVAPYIEESDMPLVYAAADVMVFPSLYEGFGLPVIEAMACGTPVVVSDIDCLVEIAGGAAHVAPAHDAAAVAEGVGCILRDSAYADQLRAAGYERARYFSWERSVEQYAAMLSDLADNQSPAMMRTCGICLGATKLFKKESHGEYTLYECAQCKGQFWDPMQAPGADWYERDTRYLDRNLDPNFRPVDTHRAFIADHPAPGGSVLDVGMGTGNFLSAAQAAGYKVAGIDFDRGAIEVAKQQFGLTDVHAASLEEFKRAHPERTFDAVTFFEVLEHLDQPGAFIDSVSEIVKPQGYIALSVPYRGSWNAFKGADVPPRHLSRWDRTSMTNFLHQHGYDVVKIRRFAATFGYLVTKFHFWTAGYASFGFVKKAKQQVIKRQGAQAVRAYPWSVRIMFMLAKCKDYILFSIPAALLYAYLLIMRKHFLGMYVLARKRT